MHEEILSHFYILYALKNSNMYYLWLFLLNRNYVHNCVFWSPLLCSGFGFVYVFEWGNWLYEGLILSKDFLFNLLFNEDYTFKDTPINKVIC